MSALPTTRRDARERALELLYEAHQKDLDVPTVLKQLPLAPDPYTRELVLGAGEHVEEAHAMIHRFTRADWSLERLPILDVLVLRIAIEELGHQHDVPRAVVIDEAVELAKNFSTDESSSFVNGMLTSIADVLRPR
jgi:transcription antitermination protein NusB